MRGVVGRPDPLPAPAPLRRRIDQKCAEEQNRHCDHDQLPN